MGARTRRIAAVSLGAQATSLHTDRASHAAWCRPSPRARPTQTKPLALTRTLLVLGAGPAQLGLLEAARGAGVRVVAADANPRAIGVPSADSFSEVSIEDEDAVRALAEELRPDGIVAPGTDFPVLVAARVAAAIGLAHPLSPEVAEAAVSKRRQRELFAAAGVPQPESRTTRTLAEAEEAARASGFPCVVKPPDRQGQRGLSFVRDEGELPHAFELALAASRGGDVLVEELVRGPELTVNAFSVDGRFHTLTITDRVVAEPPAFGVALAHVWPSEHATDAVARAAHAAADAVGVRNGPTYTQVLAGPDGPRVVELAARLGGGHDAELCEAALGIDLNRLALAAALGDFVDGEALRRQRGPGGACVRFLVPPVGALEAVEGLEDAAATEGVRWTRIYREPGFELRDLRTGADRAGAVLAVGESREQAFERAGEALARVRLSTS
jgi:biotin carboxylase